MYVIHLAKEPFKFSCSHFTILSAEKAERLHGHNYQVRVKFQVDQIDKKLGMAFDFNAVKPLIRNLCEGFDERILIPTHSPYLKVKDQAGQIEITFRKKNYSFPKEDCLVLPVVNITSEELAKYFCDELAKSIAKFHLCRRVSVNIEETRGQSVTYTNTIRADVTR